MIGIEIIGKNEFLDLSEETAIDLDLRNPLFADGDIIPGSISLPFDIPGGEVSPNNSRLLNHPDVVANLLALTRTPARIWYDGTPWKTGVITVRKATPRTISLNFRFGLTTATDDFKKIRIRDLIDEVVTMDASSFVKRIAVRLNDTTAAGRKITINDKTYDFQGFQVGPNGPLFNGVAYTAFPNTTDGANQALASCINTTSPNGVTAAYASGYVTVSVNEIDSLDAQLNIQVEPKFYWLMNSTDFEADYNAPIESYLNSHFHAAGPLLSGAITDKILFPVVANRMYDGNLIVQDGVNVVFSTGFQLNRMVTAGTFGPDNRTSICPFVRWRHVLDKVLDAMGIQGTGSFLDGDINEAVIPHSNNIDVSVATGYGEWIACQREFNIKDMVPDWTIPEFLKALQKRFNIGIDYNERIKRIEFTLREDVHADTTYKDIQSTCSPIEEVEPQDVTGLRLKSARNTRDLFSEDDQFEVGDPNHEIVSEITGWHRQETRLFDGLTTTTWDVPAASIKKDSTIVPAMMFYEEKTTGGGGPAITYGGANIDLPDCTFAFAGATGMATVRWKRHLRFLLNRRKIPVEIAFEFRELLAIDWKKKVRPVDGLNCFIDSIKVRLTMRGIVPSRCELWTTDLGILPEP